MGEDKTEAIIIRTRETTTEGTNAKAIVEEKAVIEVHETRYGITLKINTVRIVMYLLLKLICHEHIARAVGKIA